MPSYTVTVNIEDKILDTLGKGNYQLCMAKACGTKDGKPDYNVIAVTAGVASTIVITWTDTYLMCGTTQLFSAGSVLAKGFSKKLEVDFGDRYNLPSFTTKPTVVADPAAPSNGFIFSNGVLASPVVCLQSITASPGSDVSGAPIYVSPTPDIPGSDSLIPLPKVVLWFQKSVVTSMMVSIDKGLCAQLNLAEDATPTITYDDGGHWVQKKTQKIDYLQVVPAYVRGNGTEALEASNFLRFLGNLNISTVAAENVVIAIAAVAGFLVTKGYEVTYKQTGSIVKFKFGPARSSLQGEDEAGIQSVPKQVTVDWNASADAAKKYGAVNEGVEDVFGKADVTDAKVADAK